MAFYEYHLDEIPDLSLSKYSSLNESGVEGTLKQHRAFWRQLNRRGILSSECIYLIYEYNPKRPRGKRLDIELIIQTNSGENSYVTETIYSSSLGTYFNFRLLNKEEEKINRDYEYKYSVHLLKKEYFLKALKSERAYYYVSDWEMNKQGRLYSMFKLMESINRPCAYCVGIYPVNAYNEFEETLSYIIPQLQKTVRPQIYSTGNAMGLIEKDENADKVLNCYKNILEDIMENPHFKIDIQVLADDEKHARYIIDASAAEALDEGDYSWVSYNKRGLTINNIIRSGFILHANEKAPSKLKYLPQLFTLDEMVPFSVFPVLYSGEYIEIPKETSPQLEKNGLYLGRTTEGQAVYFPYSNLSKHGFVSGVPGSGKTNSMMHIASSLIKDGIPVLILEPAKHEYRGLVMMEGMDNVSIYSPGAMTCFPIHINPFQFPEGMVLAEHIRNLLAVFEGAFLLEPPMPFLLDSAIEEVYRDKKWLPSMTNRNELAYPTMSELYQKIEEKLEYMDYDSEIKGNLKSALQVRIGSLLTREMGDVFDVPFSTVRPNQWLRQSAIIELESMGAGPANFLTLMLSTLIRETLKVEDYDIKRYSGKPRHVIFFEEAHNLIGPVTEAESSMESNPKIAATNFIIKMLAEVRALGEGIIIADQLPTSMASQVIKNTSLKLALRITAQDDRELLGGTMSADSVQLERMGIFTPGKALISYESLLKPFEIQIPEFKIQKGNVSDSQVIGCIIHNKMYLEGIERSLQIRRKRWELEKKFCQLALSGLRSGVKDFNKLYQSFVQKNAALTRNETKMADKMIKKLYNDYFKLVDKSYNILFETETYYNNISNIYNIVRTYGLNDEEKEFFQNVFSVVQDEIAKTKEEIETKVLNECEQLDFKRTIKDVHEKLEKLITIEEYLFPVDKISGEGYGR